MKKIEIEFRARFDEKRYDELKDFLDTNAKNLGPDDKDVWFFIMPDKLLKVVNNISQQSAELVLKLNKIGQGSDFREIEVPIMQDDVEKWVEIFKELKIASNIMHSFQKRYNYLYRGVELALKHSDEWGYHIELEVLINDLAQKEAAEKKIRQAAKELKITLMTEQELTEFTKKAEEKYRKQQ